MAEVFNEQHFLIIQLIEGGDLNTPKEYFFPKYFWHKINATVQFYNIPTFYSSRFSYSFLLTLGGSRTSDVTGYEPRSPDIFT